MYEVYRECTVQSELREFFNINYYMEPYQLGQSYIPFQDAMIAPVSAMKFMVVLRSVNPARTRRLSVWKVWGIIWDA